jgi:hypothetical protein
MLWPGVPGWELDVEPFSLDPQHLAVPEDRRTKIREEKEELLRIAKRFLNTKLSPVLGKVQNLAISAGSPVDCHELSGPRLLKTDACRLFGSHGGTALTVFIARRMSLRH